MKKMNGINKTTKNNLITYGIVIVAFVIMQTLISTGSVSSLIEGIMVPICIYVIMAVSLNLVVGVWAMPDSCAWAHFPARFSLNA